LSTGKFAAKGIDWDDPAVQARARSTWPEQLARELGVTAAAVRAACKRRGIVPGVCPNPAGGRSPKNQSPPATQVTASLAPAEDIQPPKVRLRTQEEREAMAAEKRCSGAGLPPMIVARFPNTLNGPVPPHDLRPGWGLPRVRPKPEAIALREGQATTAAKASTGCAACDGAENTSYPELNRCPSWPHHPPPEIPRPVPAPPGERTALDVAAAVMAPAPSGSPTLEPAPVGVGAPPAPRCEHLHHCAACGQMTACSCAPPHTGSKYCDDCLDTGMFLCISPALDAVLDRLVASGVYGIDREQVVENLLNERLRQIALAGGLA
jgi:hypothetical protein